MNFKSKLCRDGHHAVVQCIIVLQFRYLCDMQYVLASLFEYLPDATFIDEHISDIKRVAVYKDFYLGGPCNA